MQGSHIQRDQFDLVQSLLVIMQCCVCQINNHFSPETPAQARAGRILDSVGNLPERPHHSFCMRKVFDLSPHTTPIHPSSRTSTNLPRSFLTMSNISFCGKTCIPIWPLVPSLARYSCKENLYPELYVGT